jgi:hypothetical protein
VHSAGILFFYFFRFHIFAAMSSSSKKRRNRDDDDDSEHNERLCEILETLSARVEYLPLAMRDYFHEIIPESNNSDLHAIRESINDLSFPDAHDELVAIQSEIKKTRRVLTEIGV